MWLTICISLLLLPSQLMAQVSCPDGSICPQGKHCCSISFGNFGCCDVWRLLLQEIDVAGREHSIGVPSTFGRNRTRRPCRSSNCSGTCCRGFCCEHRNAECCASQHLCCGVGQKCCGNGQWCCKFKLSCSSAYGYCFSPALNKTSFLPNRNGFLYLSSLMWLIVWLKTAGFTLR